VREDRFAPGRVDHPDRLGHPRLGDQDPGPDVRVEPLPAVLVRGEVAARDEGADEVGPHQGVPTWDEHVHLGQGAPPQTLAHQCELPPRPLLAGRAHGVEVGAEGGRVEIQVETEQVDLAPAEDDVHLDSDGEKGAEAAGLVEHRAVPPAIGGERVVVGDGEGPHAARQWLSTTTAVTELPSLAAAWEVEVGYHPPSTIAGRT
jgi:hypothetical protein